MFTVSCNSHFSSLNPSKAVSLKDLKSLHVYMFTFENSFVVGAAKSGGDGDIGYSCTRPYLEIHLSGTPESENDVGYYSD